jgi:Domain of unknown function (DUF4157)
MADRDGEAGRRLVTRLSQRPDDSRSRDMQATGPTAASSTSARLTRDWPSLLHLQRQYGNRYVQRLVARSVEHDGNAMRDVEGAIERTRGGGQALDRDVQAGMGRALNADFSGVRVHANAQADGLSRSLEARAFTVGHDIYFRQAEYAPGSSKGRELLAHELTHVVQQNPSLVQAKSDDERPPAGGARGPSAPGPQTKLSVSQPGDAYEQEADRVATAVLHQEQRGGVGSPQTASIQRQVPEEDEELVQTKYRDDERPQRMEQ